LQGPGMTNIALVLLVSVLNCTGQMLQKQAVLSWQRSDAMTPWRKLMSAWLLASIAALGTSMLLWLYVLRHMSLSVAYPMLSANLVLVLLGSRLFFKERITYRNWLGTSCIVFGIFLLGGAA